MGAVTAWRRGRVRRPDDRGTADALGLVLIAPVAVGLALLVVFLGRHVDSRAQVQAAAEAAAQAAARQRTPEAARAAAGEIVAATLVDADTCASPTTYVDLRAFAPGGDVAVTVTCRVSTRGIEVIGSPRDFSATAWASIDPYRASGGVSP
jgi:Flp pilus assembly protein TadG